MGEMDVDRIVRMLLDLARESRVLTGGVYKDEPIIRTGRDAFKNRPSSGSRASSRSQTSSSSRGGRSSGKPTLLDVALDLGGLVSQTAAPVPERIAQMRRLARSRTAARPSYANPVLFYEQARFMEGYVDSYPIQGSFSTYYPTYEDMSTAQLRGYFSWRTRYRAGEVPDAPLSYLFVHAYELLCGVGVAGPAQGLAALKRLDGAYGLRAGNEALHAYLAIWMRDYVVYHGLDLALCGQDAQGTALERAVAVIDAAEQSLLRGKTPAVWDAALPGIPAQDDLVRALAAASRYRLERSKVFSACFDELSACCAAVFARMVDHCHRRRKRGFAEGLFGEAQAVPYTMFRSAVFFDPVAHPDCTVRLGSGVEYSCKNGRWALWRSHGKVSPSAELGDILHEIDRVLRSQLGGFPELKERPVPKYQHALIEEEVTGFFARQAAAEAARVRIDRSVLGGIRSASARTREALLVDEERAEFDSASAQAPAVGAAPTPAVEAELGLEAAPAPAVEAELGLEAAPAPAARDVSEPQPPSAQGHAEPPSPGPQVAGLSAADAAFLRALLEGGPASAPGGMESLAVDRINEALLDLVGDTVIEYEGEVPHIIEDYADDVRGVLG